MDLQQKNSNNSSQSKIPRYVNDWQETRKMGKTKYCLTYGFGFGLLLFFFAISIDYFIEDSVDHIIYNLNTLIYFFASIIIGFIVYRFLVWPVSEKLYRKYYR
ncbi:MAG: hypothetical protein ACQESK_08155 [Bacteroidota bacterium]